MTYLANHRVQFGPCKVDLITHELWRNGIRLKLGGQPFEILIALLEQPGQLVTREVLRKRIWSEDTFVDFSHGLNAAVNKLREALCDSPDDPRYIETLPRRGYRCIAKVEEVVVQGEPEPIPVGPAHVPPAILRFDLAHPHGPSSPSRIVSGWDAIGGPQPSPNDKKLAFTAGRTASMEIWVCNLDGSSPKMLTSLRSAGTPRWSPDSRWIAFDSDGRYGHSGICVVSADGGPVAAVVEDRANNSVPSWSREGKCIYFASNRSNNWEGDQLWKVPASGGPPIEITHYGGFSAFESPDGQTIYYAKTRCEHPEIWQVSVNSGPESRVPLLHPSTWASWAVTDKGIFLLSEYSTEASQPQYLDFSTQSMRSSATLQKASFCLAASADGSAVWYSQLTNSQARQAFQARLQ
jgi:DNA-binding winged helix-turn-helix (wHTH) protein